MLVPSMPGQLIIQPKTAFKLKLFSHHHKFTLTKLQHMVLINQQVFRLYVLVSDSEIMTAINI